MRGGIVYEINSTISFSGTVLYFHENGQLQSRENYQDGLLDGLGEDFFENGQLEWRINWRDGKSNGLWEEFSENGQLLGIFDIDNRIYLSFADKDLIIIKNLGV